jgi:hypothetical protein
MQEGEKFCQTVAKRCHTVYINPFYFLRGKDSDNLLSLRPT